MSKATNVLAEDRKNYNNGAVAAIAYSVSCDMTSKAAAEIIEFMSLDLLAADEVAQQTLIDQFGRVWFEKLTNKTTGVNIMSKATHINEIMNDAIDYTSLVDQLNEMSRATLLNDTMIALQIQCDMTQDQSNDVVALFL